MKKFIMQIEQQRKEQDAIYHDVAVKYNFSDTAMWVLYIVSDSDEICTQQDLCRRSFYAKQTIHTAVNSLIKQNLVELEVIPGTRNQKKILLTDKGREAVKSTVVPLKEAENRAYKSLSMDELQLYLDMTERLTAALRDELDKL